MPPSRGMRPYRLFEPADGIKYSPEEKKLAQKLGSQRYYLKYHDSKKADARERMKHPELRMRRRERRWEELGLDIKRDEFLRMQDAQNKRCKICDHWLQSNL